MKKLVMVYEYNDEVRSVFTENGRTFFEYLDNDRIVSTSKIYFKRFLVDNRDKIKILVNNFKNFNLYSTYNETLFEDYIIWLKNIDKYYNNIKKEFENNFKYSLIDLGFENISFDVKNGVIKTFTGVKKFSLYFKKTKIFDFYTNNNVLDTEKVEMFCRKYNLRIL